MTTPRLPLSVVLNCHMASDVCTIVLSTHFNRILVIVFFDMGPLEIAAGRLSTHRCVACSRYRYIMIPFGISKGTRILCIVLGTSCQ